DPVIGSGIAPGGGGLAGGGEPEFSGHDRTNQSPGVQKEGGPARDFEYFLGLRETLKQLDTYIEEHSGTVTLGEFELVDPPTDERS
ncbi:MAG: hypothetical protein R3233_00900, partial [Xanthomonadales bacterium]|nr:hypothetical protein [Xanthomonadales bacterium]